jgi:hypothetical protein
MKFRLPGATAIAAILVAVAAPAPLALAQGGGQPPQMSRPLAKPFNEALAAIQAKDFATAQTKINEATAQAKTPFDKAQVERLKLQVASDTKNGQGQIAAINALLASGTLSPEDSKAYKGALAKGYIDAGDTAGATNAYRKFIDEYGGTPEQLMGIANDSAKVNDHQTAATYGQKAIDAVKASGGKPQEAWLRLQAQSFRNINDMGKYYATREELLTLYPNGTNNQMYWKEFIARVQSDSSLHLDMFRAITAAGVTLDPKERENAADEALKRGLPNETILLLEGGSNLSAGEQANLTKAKSQVTADKAGLAKDTTDTLAKGDGKAIALIGEAHLSYGDNAKAVEVLQAAIAKGISDPKQLALAKLHLGIAQYRNGDSQGAQTTWADAGADANIGILAKSWTMIAKSKA